MWQWEKLVLSLHHVGTGDGTQMAWWQVPLPTGYLNSPHSMWLNSGPTLFRLFANLTRWLQFITCSNFSKLQVWGLQCSLFNSRWQERITKRKKSTACFHRFWKPLNVPGFNIEGNSQITLIKWSQHWLYQKCKSSDVNKASLRHLEPCDCDTFERHPGALKLVIWVGSFFSEIFIQWFKKRKGSCWPSYSYLL